MSFIEGIPLGSGQGFEGFIVAVDHFGDGGLQFLFLGKQGIEVSRCGVNEPVIALRIGAFAAAVDFGTEEQEREKIGVIAFDIEFTHAAFYVLTAAGLGFGGVADFGVMPVIGQQVEMVPMAEVMDGPAE